MGLWSICFSQYRPPAWFQADKYMDECFWTLDKELVDLTYLFPSWFTSTQALVTVSLVLHILGIIVMVINAINCFPFSPHKNLIRLGMCLASFLLQFLVALLLTVAVTMFGSRASSETQWVETPDRTYLSWSYGMSILAAFLALLAGLVMVLEFFRLRLEMGLSKEPNVYLTNVPPPKDSSYRYAREPPAPVYPNRAGVEHGEPEYAKRYHGSQGSLNRSADPAVFKVSGSGELYINRMAEYDERQYNNDHDRGRYGNGGGPQRAQSGDRPDYRYRPNNAANGRARGYDDYEESKRTQQPVLPEYIPKEKEEDVETVETLDSDLDDIPKKDLSLTESEDEEADGRRTKTKKSKTRLDSKSKKKSRSGSADRKKSKKKTRRDDSDDDTSRRKSKRRTDTSDDERPRRRRSKDRRKSSRSRSRDLNESYSDDQLDSDRESTRGRTRRKKRDSSKNRTSSHSRDRLASAGKTRTSSRDRSRKNTKHNDDYSDENMSEYNSRHTKKKQGGGRDYSDNESVRSKSRKKPQQSYSSYYEY